MTDGRPAAAPLSSATLAICHRLMQAATTLASNHRGPCLLRPSALPIAAKSELVNIPEISPPGQSSSSPPAAHQRPSRSIAIVCDDSPCPGSWVAARIQAAYPQRCRPRGSRPDAASAVAGASNYSCTNTFCLLRAPIAHHPCCPSDSPRSPRGHHTRRAGPVEIGASQREQIPCRVRLCAFPNLSPPTIPPVRLTMDPIDIKLLTCREQRRRP